LSIDEFLADLDGVEAEDALEHFDTMDTDGDGFLEKGEISVGPKRDARERREARFETQDIDSDGFLSLDEYLTEVPEQHVDKATERFAAMDIDEDGGLGIDEITGCKK
jgi:Ca2+-binding EF-hand superfamily protein